jgi:hypothetical protein
MKFVSPRNDLAFKKIFGNENRKNILISFLNAVLNLQGDRTIEDLEILNPYQAHYLSRIFPIGEIHSWYSWLRTNHPNLVSLHSHSYQ